MDMDPTTTHEETLEQPTPSLFDQADAMEAAETPTQDINIDTKEFDIDISDHNPENEAMRSADADDGVASPNELPHPHTRIERLGALADPVGKLMNDLDPFADDFKIGKVEVTIAERDAFVRAALHDEEMSFDIHLEGLDIYVKVVIPPESFTTMVANTIDAWDSNGVTNAKNNVSWLLLFQQLHAWYQVRSFAGKPTAWSTFFDDGVPKISKLREFVSNVENFENIVNMSAPRWRMMVSAMALAEYKYKLCLDAWRTRSFFEKADTA